MFVMTPAITRMAKEYADKMIADRKQRKAEYLAARDEKLKTLGLEIGRASCRERVSPYV